MDALDEVLAGVRFRALLSARMRLAAPWAFVGARDEHTHFYVITEGRARMTFTAGRGPLTLRAGDVVLVAAGTTHTIHDPTSRAPTRRLEWPAASVFELAGTGPTTELSSGCLEVEDPDRTPLWAALPEVLHVSGARARARPLLHGTTRLLGDGALDGPGGHTVAARLADVLVIEVIREYLRTAGAELAGWLGGLTDPRLHRALSAMHREPERTWSVVRLARLSGMSRTAFATRFSARLGRGPLDYLRILRLQRAATMLRTRDDASIGDIAARVGYGSEAAFSRAFGRWAGMPPSAYRRRARGN